MATQDEAVIARRAGRLSSLLKASDVPPRAVDFPAQRIEVARRSRLRATTWRWRAAAAAVVLMSAALAVEPVRAWITGAARDLMHRFASDPVPQPTAPGADPAAVSDAANRVSFTPPPDLFVLEVASRQAAGRLTIEPVAGASASAEVRGSANDAELIVMPTGLRIVNRATAASWYTVRVPVSLSRVVIRIGRESAVMFTPASAAPMTIELGRDGTR